MKGFSYVIHREQDKERGKTQKITEAKTPYYRGEFDSSESGGEERKGDKVFKDETQAVDLNLVSQKLEESSKKPERRDWSDDYSSDSSAKGKNNEEFKKKRKMHYDEGRALKEIMKKDKAPMNNDDEDAQPLRNRIKRQEKISFFMMTCVGQ
eukprot:TRINITY_DN984_c0_g1_i6.p2 TRINITY_DN984_c0_g1~~TRINITY_DN984_c0_g1_i6.p2  ORF type:complete len:152 (+),score=30.01 TRINITY_DN984_c0_g1_i6:223-678(+)